MAWLMPYDRNIYVCVTLLQSIDLLWNIDDMVWRCFSLGAISFSLFLCSAAKSYVRCILS